ncbi:hypothetical protein ACTXI2_09255 [Glutamicibacter arilaitensis]|uniref:hypothetical protein n=1 Tax=Glutamicibacter arilaitensis TaxID=256701 RepID=UPI003FD4B600
MAKEITISSERLNADHPLGPLVPMERFDWERILGRCKFKPRSSAKVVGYTLATFADLKTGGNIKPGNKLIGLRAGVGKDAVINAMQTLHDIGLIHKVRNGSNFGRGGKTSEFRLTAPEGLAETYYEERNARTWDYSDQWPIETWLEQVGSSGLDNSGEQVGSSGGVSSESDKNRSVQPDTKESRGNHFRESD